MKKTMKYSFFEDKKHVKTAKVTKKMIFLIL